MDKKTTFTKNTAYQCPEHIRYVIERTSIRLIDTQRGHTLIIKYPDAAIWDFLCRCYSWQRIARLLTSICHLTKEHAESMIDDFLAMLLNEGFLKEVKKNG